MFTLKLPNSLAIEWTMLALAFVFTLLRTSIRIWQRRQNTVDTVIIIAWLLMAAGVSLDTTIFLIKMETKQTELQYDLPRMKRILIVGYINMPVQYLSLWAIKTALLVFYYNLFHPTMRILRYCLHATAAIVVLSFIVTQLLNYFWCLPIKRNWDVYNPKTLCMAGVAYFPYFTTLTFHLLTDILLYCLPFPLLRALHLEPRKKFGVVLMFSLGFVSVACTIGRCVVSVTSGEIGLIGMLGAIEQASAITVVCIPALKSFIQSLESHRNGRSHCSSSRETLSRKGRFERTLRMIGWKFSSAGTVNSASTTTINQKHTLESRQEEIVLPCYAKAQRLSHPSVEDMNTLLSGLTAPPRRLNMASNNKEEMNEA